MVNATIHTLVPDIYKLIGERHDAFPDKFAESLSRDIASRVNVSLRRSQEADRGTLRLSKMGPQCPRSLWYSVHHPELAEDVPPWAKIKFAYGHVLEALAISLAKTAGHLVQGEQDELYVDGIRGHRDAVIDGCIVDVKSCSSIQFAKYKDKSICKNDSFGYLDQLDGYVVGSANDDLVTDKQHGYILAIDKTLGHMVLYEHTVRPDQILARIKLYKSIVASNSPPICTCVTRPEGKAGNIGLGVVASYSAFKFCCFPELRTFLYADGPKYLTHVARRPDVPEIDRQGKIVYN